MTGAQPGSGHDRCGAKTRGGGTCRLPAGWGCDHPVGPCKLHSGRTPNHVAHAQRVMEEQAAKRFALPVVTTARAALAAELARTNGLVIWLTARCQELAEAGELTWSNDRRIVKTTAQSSGQRGQGQPTIEVHLAARLHPLAAWLERERRHLAAVAAEMERLGIDRRVVEVAEQQAAQLKRILDGALADSGLRPEDQARVVAALPGVIRRLNGVPG